MNFEKMKLTIMMAHVYKSNDNPDTCKEVSYKVSTGYHLCISSTKTSGLDQFGVGFVLYFKFLKPVIQTLERKI